MGVSHWIVGFVAVVALATPAMAAENLRALVGSGSVEQIRITQSKGGGHSASITVSGSLNKPTGLAPELTANTVAQTGWGQAVSLQFQGTGNSFALSQSGQGHAITGTISGGSNQFKAMQTGAGHAIAFSQNGSGNVINLRQSN